LRKPATIFLLLIFCNGFFYYAYFSFSITKAKLEAAKKITDLGVEKSDLILKVPVSRLQKDESDEVWFNNKLYDVVDRKKIEGVDYVLLLQDEDEQNVLVEGNNYFQHDENMTLGKTSNQLSAKKISFKMDHNYFPNLFEEMDPFYLLSIPRACKNKSFLDPASKDVPSPPPKQIL
jgi:hypothetical protein